MIFTSLLCRFIGSNNKQEMKEPWNIFMNSKIEESCKRSRDSTTLFFFDDSSRWELYNGTKKYSLIPCKWGQCGDRKFNEKNIHVTPLPFLHYSPLTEFCIQLALGVFRIFKAPFWQDLSKYTLSNSLAKFIALTLSFTFLYVRKYKFDEW